MAGRKKQVEADEPASAPEWMVTFSDCMTLLLTFFVLLLSFSSFDENVFLKLKAIFAESLSTVSKETKSDKDAFLLVTTPIQYLHQEVDKGSEKPTLERGRGNNLQEETESADFNNRKVFCVSSTDIFWGNGTIISFQGRKTLSTLAAFLKEVPSRVVISENGQTDQKDDEGFGLARAWAVINFFTEKQGLDKKQFSISVASTISQEKLKSTESGSPAAEAERLLEIVLLERSIYN